MKSILTILFTLSFFNISAQVKTIYFYGDSVVSDSTIATSYGVYGKLATEDVWRIKLYDLNNNLLATGSYKDEKLSIPHGKFSYYIDINRFNQENETNFSINGISRFLSQQGSFNEGAKTGRWITFFPDGSMMQIKNYANGIENGEYKLFNKRGKVSIVGFYSLGRKDGEWNYNTGKKEVYKNGVLISTNK